MKKRWMFAAALVLLAALAAGCGGTGGGDAVAAGEELFNQGQIEGSPGCVTCHSLEAGETQVGPSLAGFGEKAAQEAGAAGLSAEEYIRQSIVEPDQVVAEGFNAGVMPGNYGEVLSDQQLENLVAFLDSLK